MPLPSITAIGGLVRDPELKFSKNNQPWVRFSLACKDRVRGQSGEWQDGEATFITVKAFGRVAENLIESAAVGDTLTVVGKLQQDRWETEDGQKRSDFSIIADTIAVAITWNTAKTPRVLGENNGAKGSGMSQEFQRARKVAEDAGMLPKRSGEFPF